MTNPHTNRWEVIVKREELLPFLSTLDQIDGVGWDPMRTIIKYWEYDNDIDRENCLVMCYPTEEAKMVVKLKFDLKDFE